MVRAEQMRLDTHCHLSTVSPLDAQWTDVFKIFSFQSDVLHGKVLQSEQKGGPQSAKTINYANVGFLLAAPVGSCTGTGDAVWHWHPGTYAGVGLCHSRSPRVVSPSSGYRVATAHSSQCPDSVCPVWAGPPGWAPQQQQGWPARRPRLATLVLHWTLTSAQARHQPGWGEQKNTQDTPARIAQCVNMHKLFFGPPNKWLV